MKKLAGLAVLGLLAVAAFAAGVGEARAEDPIVLKFHHFLGPTAPAHTQMIEPWARKVEKESNGRIKIEIYPAMALGGKPPQLIRQLRDGVVDLVWTVTGYTAGQFPRSEVFELPFIHTNNTIATNLAMRDLYDEYLAEEYADVHPIVLHVHAGQGFHMVDTPVHKPEDLAGKKMRIPTRTGAWILEALGANPVGMPVPEFPQALSKKVVDGGMIPWEIITPLKIQELTKYQIEGYNGTRFGTTVFLIGMNKERYESLPDDLKKVIDDNSGEDFARQVGQIWMDVEAGGLQAALDAGNEHIVLTKEETEAFRGKLEPVIDRWIKEVEEKGIDGRAMVAAARAAIAKHSR